MFGSAWDSAAAEAESPPAVAETWTPCNLLIAVLVRGRGLRVGSASQCQEQPDDEGDNAAAKTNADGREIPIPQPPARSILTLCQMWTKTKVYVYFDPRALNGRTASVTSRGHPVPVPLTTTIETVSPGRRASTALCSAVGDRTA